MNTIYIALGSNVGDSNNYFNQTLQLLQMKIHTIQESKRYVTKPVGYTDQADFLNSVISGNTDLSPTDLLTFTQEVEHTIGRTKTFRWGPREIDIDILFYNNDILHTHDLIIPHPRLDTREFVLLPMYNLNKDFIHPVLLKTIGELYNQVQKKELTQ